MLKSCFELLDVGNLEKIHVHVIKLGFDLYELVGSVVLEMNKVINDSGNVCEVIEKKPVR